MFKDLKNYFNFPIFYLILICTPLLLQAEVVQPKINGTCVSSPEICGDGVDENCDGVDPLCQGNDKDGDGFTTNDCDDNNRDVYPDRYTSCTAGCGSGFKLCQQNGTFGNCSCATICEATGNSKCYYVSQASGNDTNTGTFQSPWKSFNRFKHYWGNVGQPANWVRLNPGDIVYLMDGTFSQGYHFDQLNTVIGFVDIVAGTNPIKIKTYPGRSAVIAPPANTAAFELYRINGLTLEGIEIRNAYQYGIQISDSSNFKIKSMSIHDTDGVDNNNISGVYVVDTQNYSIENSLIYDNYDRTNADTGGVKTENSRNVSFFRGGNGKILNSTLFNSRDISDPKGGGCIVYKHSITNTALNFEAGNNKMFNCSTTSIGTGSMNSYIHHNIVVNSDAFQVKDLGGPTYIQNIRIENNTIVNGYLQFQPGESYGPVSNLIFKDNIVVDNKVNVQDRSLWTLEPYGTDATFSDVVSNHKLTASGNCYYNSAGEAKFVVYGAYENLGSTTNFSGWKAYGFDTTGSMENPNFDANFVARSANCSGKGWSANPLPPDTTPPSKVTGVILN